ncbi:serine/threonine-protein kinase [Streptomyces sp. NBC_01304]|uniref:serine/threonine-protein kinase n=1 Tax=Streptomyces sp. NBC_01304 TaxID=2903818 RepID=UPI002E0FC1E9|nr:serine/threonine protein kinase [Streptomyces sp. NBC_01304]
MEELAPDEPREIAGYRLQARLGQGGMGVVYLSHTRGGQPVALKVVRREYAQDPLFQQRFTQEVAAARRVQGPYTAPVLDSRTDGSELWLATAYVPGPPLSVAVGRHGPLPLASVLKLMGGIAEALVTIHGAGVVHRDLKPSNVLLAADGPRVIDFGIARAADAAGLTGTSVALGTPAYMAPEQAMGGEITPALDVFALGLIVHFALTGQHAYGDGPSQAILHRIVANQPELSGCPQEIRGLVESCLAKDAAARPTPAEIVEHCHAVAGAGGLARGDGWWLPAGVAQEVAEQEQTMHLHAAAADQARLPTQASPAAPGTPPQQPPGAPAFGPGTPGQGVPGQGAPAAYAHPAQPYAQPAAPAYSPAPPPGGPAAGAATTSTAAPRPRRTGVLVAAAVAGVLVVGGGSVFGYKMLAEDGGSDDKNNSADQQNATTRPGEDKSPGSGQAPTTPAAGGNQDPTEEPVGDVKTEEGWRLTLQDTSVTLQGPKPASGGYNMKCDAKADTYIIDVDNDFKVTHPGNMSAAEFLGALAYHACEVPDQLEGLQTTNGNIMNTTTEEFPTPGECRKTARASTLPNPIPLKKLRDNSVLKQNMGLCIETADKSVAHLWIRQINVDGPKGSALPTYLTTATLWKPEQ